MTIVEVLEEVFGDPDVELTTLEKIFLRRWARHMDRMEEIRVQDIETTESIASTNVSMIAMLGNSKTVPQGTRDAIKAKIKKAIATRSLDGRFARR